MKRFMIFLLLIGAFLISGAQTNEHPVVAYPGVETPIIQGFDVTTIVGTDTMFVASLPPKSSHAWSSTTLMSGVGGDTYVSLWARGKDALGNYYWEPYNSSPGDTLGATDSSFFFEDIISAQTIVGLKITPGSAGLLDWDLFAKEMK